MDLQRTATPFKTEKYIELKALCNGLNHKQRRSIFKREKRRIKRIRNAKLKESFSNINATHKEEFVDLDTFLNKIKEENEKANEMWLAYENMLVKSKAEAPEQVKNDDVPKAEEEIKQPSDEQTIAEDQPQEIDTDPPEKESSILSLLFEIDEDLKTWHNPFAPEEITNVNNNVTVPTPQIDPVKQQTAFIAPKQKSSICSFFAKVGACKFRDDCSRIHNYPEISCIVLYQNMFHNFAFEMSSRISKANDVDLEYTDSSLQDDFEQFEKDVLNELKKYGDIVQFKVSCNREMHLQGNVYVQYSKNTEAKTCFNETSGRFYNGKLMNPRFVMIPSWRAAICGLHYKTKVCPHGRRCNFLHVFRSRHRQFLDADVDIFKAPSPQRSHTKHKHKYKSDKKSRKHRSRSRSRSLSKERSHKKSKKHKKSSKHSH